MLSVKGTFRNGVAQPNEPVEGRAGRDVIIVFLEGDDAGPALTEAESENDSLLRLIHECQMDVGIEDLAHHHDHYLHDKPKRP
ncbi:MAG TPA: hypothetical protein VF590_05855 [Isosphaeraceae bacterium]|jgi:hypothetical protein